MRVNNRRRLTREQAREVREKFADGDSYEDLSREYRMSPRLIRHIVYYDIYVDAGGPYRTERKRRDKPKRVLKNEHFSLTTNWVVTARNARKAGGCTWSQVATIVGKTVHKVRYAVDDNYRNALLRKANEAYAKIKKAKNGEEIKFSSFVPSYPGGDGRKEHIG